MHATRSALLPPGPTSPMLETLRYMRDPIAYYAQRRRAYGDPLTLPTLNGPLVVTGHPEGARTIFSLGEDETEAWLPEILGTLVGERSVIVMSGERHRRERKLLNPHFHGARMRAYGRLMQDVAREVSAAWPVGVPFDVRPHLQAISLRIILRAVFGLDDPDQMRETEAATVRYVARGNRPTVVFPKLRADLWGLGPWAGFLRARTHYHALVELQIRRRRAAAGEDILSMLLAARYEDGSAMSDAHIRDELVTLLTAGHETTAQMLSWALAELLRSPAVLDRLRAELRALGPDPEPEQIAASPYLDAVCCETLRRRPINAEVPRVLRKPITLLGHALPAGTAVATSVPLLHSRQDLYPQPELFRPERFLTRKFSPFEFVSFGGGARRCLGAAFAMYEAKLVLYELLTGLSLRLADTRPAVAQFFGITMGPRGGVPVVRTA